MKIKIATVRSGFTLGELLIVLGIISILLTTILIGYNNVLRRSRDTQRLVDMQNIKQALEMFYQDNGHYPGPVDNPSCPSGTSISLVFNYIGINGCIDHLLAEYMEDVPHDPMHDISNTNTPDSPNAPQFAYLYDPQNCNRLSTDPGNCTFSATCGGIPAIQSATIGFRTAEVLTNLRVDTVCNNNNGFAFSNYNISIYPFGPSS
jgi:prepilin-type N-terminal cleavage/methylation domain-containing protein